MNPSEHIKELKIDSTLWTDPKRIINLLDFDPKKLSIYTELNSISNTPDASSKDLIEVYEVRYDDGGFYLVFDDIKGYFNVDDNVGSILNMKLTDNQKIKYHQVWKEILISTLLIRFNKNRCYKNLVYSKCVSWHFFESSITCARTVH